MDNRPLTVEEELWVRFYCSYVPRKDVDMAYIADYASSFATDSLEIFRQKFRRQNENRKYDSGTNKAFGISNDR